MTTDLAKSYTCTKCKGSKTMIVNVGFFMEAACDECQGTGKKKIEPPTVEGKVISVK